MKRFFIAFFIIGLLATGALRPGCLARENRILRVSDSGELNLSEIHEDLQEARLIFVGETHDRAAHHKAQLAVVRLLHEAQIVWDTAMAWHLLRFLREHPTCTVVVMAGNGHAWKRGIPEQIQRQSSVPRRVIPPEQPGRLDRADVTLEDADYLWLIGDSKPSLSK